MGRGLLVVALLVAAACLLGSNGQRCPIIEGVPGCVCDTDKGVIDLTSIANESGATLAKPKDENGYTYYYNPCFGLKGMPSPCDGDDIAICQQDKFNPQTYYEIANLASEQMYVEGDLIFLEYVLDKRTTIVKLICDLAATTPIVTTTGDSEKIFQYHFTLTTICACPNECPSVLPSGGVTAGTIGIVLMIISIVGVLAYFVIGSIVMKFHYHKEGSEIIPNKNFWFLFPFLIWDGIKFTFGPLINLASRQRTGQQYQKL